MANNLAIKDGAGANQSLKTTDNAGVHTTHHIIDSGIVTVIGSATAEQINAELKASAQPIMGEVFVNSPVTLSSAVIAAIGDATDAKLKATPQPVAIAAAPEIVQTPAGADHDLNSGPLTITLTNGTAQTITLAGKAIGRTLLVNPQGDAAVTVTQQMVPSGPWMFPQVVTATSADDDKVTTVSGRVHAIRVQRTAGTDATSTVVLS